MLLLMPRAASAIGNKIDLPNDYTVSLGILACCLFGSYQIYKSPQFGQNWRLLKCITLLEISALSSAMALSNFSLAYIVTLLMAPVGKENRNIFLITRWHLGHFFKKSR